MFSFTTRGGSVTLAVEPEGVAIGGSKFVTNMNVRVQLYNEAGDLLVEDDPDNSYAASITTELEAATIRFMLKEPIAVALMFLDLVTTVALVSMDSTGDVEGLGGLDR